METRPHYPITKEGVFVTSHRYGRGKFEAHAEYIEYMRMIVEHPNYSGMPNAIGTGGRINWQVSSGKSTSFYRDYLARKQWWTDKALEIGVDGAHSDKGSFTTVARIIHPTGYRPCRLCGKKFNVGYFYVNSLLAKKLKKSLPNYDVQKHESIANVITNLKLAHTPPEVDLFFLTTFPERKPYFHTHGVEPSAFEASRHLSSSWLSPGFMGNPPDRLDGFHDYDVTCRKANDPGRSDENMRSYNHDRRTFEWWAEGNWAIADALYNSASSGICAVDGCGTKLKKVSPDHVGPLACGFKQMPFFEPTCQSHNSSKNRRFTHGDVLKLISYEETNNLSVASWQVQAHWDRWKRKIESDDHALALSNSMRSLQDMYMRVLHQLLDLGFHRLLATFLRPEYALLDVAFLDLDGSKLTFESVSVTTNASPLRLGQTGRVVRIAFEALRNYVEKPADQRKLARPDHLHNQTLIAQVLQSLPAPISVHDYQWKDAFNLPIEAPALEEIIRTMLVEGKAPADPLDSERKLKLTALFNEIGKQATVDFERYQLI